jgi:uncharacterized membrane protein YgaE (UPF0421/DUF939 family)
MKLPLLSKWLIGLENPVTGAHAARTAAASILSLGLARLLPFPQSYWAPISTLVVMQSTLEASFLLAVQRIAGTALGVSLGALFQIYFHQNLVAFGIGIFLIGMLFAALRVERSVFRYAGIALAIVMLVPRAESAWVVAGHRFLEVSLGIAVALGVTAAWPEQKPRSPGSGIGAG